MAVAFMSMVCRSAAIYVEMRMRSPYLSTPDCVVASLLAFHLIYSLNRPSNDSVTGVTVSRDLPSS